MRVVVKDSTAYALIGVCVAFTVSTCMNSAHWTSCLWLLAVWYALIIVLQHRLIHPDEPPTAWSWVCALHYCCLFVGSVFYSGWYDVLALNFNIIFCVLFVLLCALYVLVAISWFGHFLWI
jgi:hypothetical protein